MISVTNLIGENVPNLGKVSIAIAKTVYSQNAIIFERPLEVFLKTPLPIATPCPLIGFYFDYASDIPLLNYQWSEYPYLSRESLVNAAIKQPTRFTISLYNPLGKGEIVPTVKTDKTLTSATIDRNALKFVLETYTDGGGTFTVNTLWGTLTGCVLEGLDGVQADGTNGTAFNLRFYKPCVGKETIGNKLSSFLQKLVNGGF